MISPKEESVLIKKIKAGDQRSFETLEKESRRKIFLHVKSMTKNAHEAEDIYQNGIIKAWLKIDKFRGDCRFSTWLCRICHNLAYDEFRRKKRRPTTSLDRLIESGVMTEEKIFGSTEEAKNESRSKSDLQELKRKLDKTLLGIPQKHRKVLTMFTKDGMSYLEIAKALNISAGTVMSRLFYARKYARKSYNKITERDKE